MTWFVIAEMFISLGAFGMLYWLCDGIMGEIISVSATGIYYTFLMFIWDALPVIVILFAGFYLLSMMQKQMYTPGGRV
jgi:hypothetical protein